MDIRQMQQIAHFLVVSSGQSYADLAQTLDVPVPTFMALLRTPNDTSEDLYRQVFTLLGHSSLEQISDFIEKNPALIKYMVQLQDLDTLISQVAPGLHAPLVYQNPVSLPPQTPEAPISVAEEKLDCTMDEISFSMKTDFLSFKERESQVRIAVGKKIRDIRTKMKLSQLEFADKTEVHQTTVSALERGFYPIRRSRTFHVALNRVGISLDALIQEAERSLAHKNGLTASQMTNMDRSLVVSNMEEIGSFLFQERTKQSLSILQAAQKAGVQEATLRNMELGHYPLPLSNLHLSTWEKVCSLYGISVENLLDQKFTMFQTS